MLLCVLGVFGDRFCDHARHVVGRRSDAGFDGVENGPMRRAAVTDDHGAGDAQERRTAAGLGIHHLLQVPKCALEQQRPQDPKRRAGASGLKTQTNRLRNRFGRLEDHVADEAVADGDVDVPL